MYEDTSDGVFQYFDQLYDSYKSKWPDFDGDLFQIECIGIVDLVICCFLNKYTVISGINYLNELKIAEQDQEKYALKILGFTRLIAHCSDKHVNSYIQSNKPYICDVIGGSKFGDLKCLESYINSHTFWEAIEKEFEYSQKIMVE
eukprot:NODE_10_length_61504_cov_0.956502.p44 type:complete len:145 gc:universal NODE_10_length_61504_cov_0.956502:32891-33325(+)